MSTEQQQLSQQPPRGLLNRNTTSRSIRAEWRDARVEPEDWRTRRFGYNPGFLMTMDPVHTGLQTSLIEPGYLQLFESGPVKRQNWDVDPESNKAPDRDAELLAGEGLTNIYVQYAHMGWREIVPLRGMDDDSAEELFYYAHPPLVECVRAKLIEPCLYGLEVCITCRKNALAAIHGHLPAGSISTHKAVSESVAVGESYMRAQWNIFRGELAESASANRGRATIGKLEEGHLFFMRQLHERTPSDLELHRIEQQNQMQSDVLKETLAQQREMMNAMFAANNREDPRIAQMQSTIDRLEKLIMARDTPADLDTTGEGGN
jgi:hypothetical protein